MKVILYMGVTADGFIAENDDTSDFLTLTESASYVEAVKNAGALVIGRRTYEILSGQPEFKEFLKAGVKIVTISRSDFKTKHPTHTVAHSPKDALAFLKDSERVIVAGGGKLNAAFLRENLLDELYLDVEPTLIGNGIPLFKGDTYERKLKLLETKILSPDEIQLHYEVLK